MIDTKHSGMSERPRQDGGRLSKNGRHIRGWKRAERVWMLIVTRLYLDFGASTDSVTDERVGQRILLLGQSIGFGPKGFRHKAQAVHRYIHSDTADLPGADR